MHKRSLFFALAPILAVVLVAVLLYAVRSSSQPPPSTLDDTIAALATAIPKKPTAALPTTAALPKTAVSQNTATSLSPSTPTQEADSDIVALVNGQALRVEDLALAQAVDGVMSRLLGTRPATGAQVIEQMMNHTLVAQQAAAGGSVPAVDAQSQLAALLSSAGKTEADLTAALADAGVGRAEFDQYFSDLLTVQQFAQQAAATQNRTVDAYITGLQTVARISYGPAAAPAAQAAAVAPQAETGSTATTLFSPIAQSVAEQAVAEQAVTGTVVTGTVVTGTVVTGTVVTGTAVTGTAPSVTGETSANPTAAVTTTATAVTATTSVTATTALTSEARGLEVGQLAPDFALATLGEEDNQTEFDDLLGQPVVLSFWTTWCPYCLRQTPVLVAAAGQYTDGIRFVGVDVGEDAATVTPYVEQHAIPYTILLDQNSRIAAAYAVEGFPTTYFLDADGRIVARQIGSLSEEQLQQYVEQLLASRS